MHAPCNSVWCVFVWERAQISSPKFLQTTFAWCGVFCLSRQGNLFLPSNVVFAFCFDICALRFVLFDLFRLYAQQIIVELLLFLRRPCACCIMLHRVLLSRFCPHFRREMGWMIVRFSPCFAHCLGPLFCFVKLRALCPRIPVSDCTFLHFYVFFSVFLN